ncbi:unnamed protein product [Albugo candida]|uniref:Uncharacterized protein n=1 Tax=Albugo candida TaxID=65357 RepID=A0A024GEN2_9STRA|nr:unnamed protein product [Albugo candida]|eukprot:CCI45329.1 unnamed protein product [Albugo candida]
MRVCLLCVMSDFMKSLSSCYVVLEHDGAGFLTQLIRFLLPLKISPKLCFEHHGLTSKRLRRTCGECCCSDGESSIKQDDFFQSSSDWYSLYASPNAAKMHFINSHKTCPFRATSAKSSENFSFRINSTHLWAILAAFASDRVGRETCCSNDASERAFGTILFDALDMSSLILNNDTNERQSIMDSLKEKCVVSVIAAVMRHAPSRPAHAMTFWAKFRTSLLLA